MGTIIKKSRSKAAKIAGAALFILLMFVNLQITTNPNSKGDIDLFGLKISLFTPSAYATGSGSYCYYWSTYWQGCVWPEINCLCDVIVRP